MPHGQLAYYHDTKKSSIILAYKLVRLVHIHGEQCPYMRGISSTCCPSTPRCQHRPCRNASAHSVMGRVRCGAIRQTSQQSCPTVATCRRRQLLRLQRLHLSIQLTATCVQESASFWNYLIRNRSTFVRGS